MIKRNQFQGQHLFFVESIVCLIVCVTIFCVASVPVFAQEASSTPRITQIFETFQATYLEESVAPPDFSLPSVAGKDVTLSDLKGKVVLLNFWATWCPYCRTERPTLQALYEKYKERGLIVAAISIDRTPTETVKSYVEEHKLTFLNLHDQTSAIAREYGIRGVPSTFFLLPDGKVIGGVIGPRGWDGPEAQAIVEYLLSQQP